MLFCVRRENRDMRDRARYANCRWDRALGKMIAGSRDLGNHNDPETPEGKSARRPNPNVKNALLPISRRVMIAKQGRMLTMVAACKANDTPSGLLIRREAGELGTAYPECRGLP
jgi:hypothetical protein